MSQQDNQLFRGELLEIREEYYKVKLGAKTEFIPCSQLDKVRIKHRTPGDQEIECLMPSWLYEAKFES